MPVAMLDDDRVGLLRDGMEGGGTGEGVEALRKALIAKATAANVGYIDTELQFVFAMGVSDDIGAIEVAFGSAVVTLRTASGLSLVFAVSLNSPQALLIVLSRGRLSRVYAGGK